MPDPASPYPPELWVDALNTVVVEGDRVILHERCCPHGRIGCPGPARSAAAVFTRYVRADPLRALVDGIRVVRCVHIEPVRPTGRAVQLLPAELALLRATCLRGSPVYRSTTGKDWDLSANRWRRCGTTITLLERAGLVVLAPNDDRDRARYDRRRWLPTTLGRHTADAWPQPRQSFDIDDRARRSAGDAA